MKNKIVVTLNSPVKTKRTVRFKDKNGIYDCKAVGQLYIKKEALIEAFGIEDVQEVTVTIEARY